MATPEVQPAAPDEVKEADLQKAVDSGDIALHEYLTLKDVNNKTAYNHEEQVDRSRQALKLMREKMSGLSKEKKLLIINTTRGVLEGLHTEVTDKLRTTADKKMDALKLRIEDGRTEGVNDERKISTLMEQVGIEKREIGKDLKEGGWKSYLKYAAITAGVAYAAHWIWEKTIGTGEKPGFFRKLAKLLFVGGAAVAGVVGLSKLKGQLGSAANSLIPKKIQEIVKPIVDAGEAVTNGIGNGAETTKENLNPLIEDFKNGNYVMMVKDGFVYFVNQGGELIKRFPTSLIDAYNGNWKDMLKVHAEGMVIYGASFGAVQGILRFMKDGNLKAGFATTAWKSVTWEFEVLQGTIQGAKKTFGAIRGSVGTASRISGSITDTKLVWKTRLGNIETSHLYDIVERWKQLDQAVKNPRLSDAARKSMQAQLLAHENNVKKVLMGMQKEFGSTLAHPEIEKIFGKSVAQQVSYAAEMNDARWLGDLKFGKDTHHISDVNDKALRGITRPRNTANPAKGGEIFARKEAAKLRINDFDIKNPVLRKTLENAEANVTALRQAGTTGKVLDDAIHVENLARARYAEGLLGKPGAYLDATGKLTQEGMEILNVHYLGGKEVLKAKREYLLALNYGAEEAELLLRSGITGEAAVASESLKQGSKILNAAKEATNIDDFLKFHNLTDKETLAMIQSSNKAKKLLVGALQSSEPEVEVARMLRAARLARNMRIGFNSLAIGGDVFGMYMAYQDYEENGRKIADTDNAELQALYSQAQIVNMVEGGVSATGLVITGTAIVTALVQGQSVVMALAAPGSMAMLPVAITMIASKWMADKYNEASETWLKNEKDWAKLDETSLLQKLLELGPAKQTWAQQRGGGSWLDSSIGGQLWNQATMSTEAFQKLEEQRFKEIEDANAETRSKIMKAYFIRSMTSRNTVPAFPNDTEANYKRRSDEFVADCMRYVYATGGDALITANVLDQAMTHARICMEGRRLEKDPYADTGTIPHVVMLKINDGKGNLSDVTVDIREYAGNAFDKKREASAGAVTQQVQKFEQHAHVRDIQSVRTEAAEGNKEEWVADKEVQMMLLTKCENFIQRSEARIRDTYGDDGNEIRFMAGVQTLDALQQQSAILRSKPSISAQDLNVALEAVRAAVLPNIGSPDLPAQAKAFAESHSSSSNNLFRELDGTSQTARMISKEWLTKNLKLPSAAREKETYVRTKGEQYLSGASGVSQKEGYFEYSTGFSFNLNPMFAFVDNAWHVRWKTSDPWKNPAEVEPPSGTGKADIQVILNQLSEFNKELTPATV